MKKAMMKKLAVIVVGILLLAAIPLTVFLVGQRQELRKKAAPATTLSLAPATVTKKVGETFTLDVQLDTGENQVVAAELHIVYDPAKLEAQTIANGPLFPRILASGTVDRGTASITVGAEGSAKPVTGGGIAASVRFKALDKTDAPVSVRFAANTFVGSLGEGATNVLVGTRPATVTITADTVSQPAPSQPATPSAQGFSGSLTPTPAPSLGASGSAQASSSAVQILSPVKNGSVADTKPTFRGKAAPGATVTLTIYSTPQTVVVTADANGNWVYTPEQPLEDGPHNVVATAQNPATGTPQTATTTFVVASGQGTASESAIPIAGSSTPTMLLILLGTLLIASGIMIPVLAR